MREQDRSFCKNTEAVTEVIGEVMLTAIAVLAFSVIAVFVFSYANPEERVHADIDGWVNVNSDSIVLRHAGGEPIDIERTRMLLDLNGTRKELDPANLKFLTGTNSWQLGEMIVINTSSFWGITIDENDIISATIIHKDSNLVIKSGALLGFEGITGSGSNNGNTTPPQPPGPSIPGDQIAWWKLNENTGTLASDSIGSHDGTINSASWTTGINSSALNFDGSTSYVQVNERIISGYPFTISAWVKTTDSGSDQAIANIADSSHNKKYYGIYVDSSGKASLMARKTQEKRIIGSTINDGNWHHVVGVFTSANDRTLYVDGLINGTDTATVNFDVNVDRWAFGRWTDSTPSNYFDGSIDEVKLWDRALNATEVQQLYLNP
ncbi:LamG-like jellyroll fold domain-containing protein [Methanolobus sp. ZRKC3]|uniref:LamG-like jellyroll fold domain-containing protein n=1 Tax=Methanolobus sp. ZRKC3 TaxID=3125786 RepID=UPI003244DD09